MLTALDVREGHTMLEIGPVLADRTRAALQATDLPVTVVAGDGIHGHPAGAPYDRGDRHRRRPGR